MLRIDEQWKVFWDILCWVIRSSLCASTWYLIAVKLYLFMLLGIRLCIIMCLTTSTWKQNWIGKAQSRQYCAALPISRSRVSASKVNRSGAEAQVISCRRFLAVFYPIVCMHNLCNLKITHYSCIILRLECNLGILRMCNAISRLCKLRGTVTYHTFKHDSV